MAWWTSPAPIRSDRRFAFDATPSEVWRRLEDVGSYRGWWSWLREFDGTELTEGEVWRCKVQPPAPYAVRFTVTLTGVEPQRRVAAAIAGDIEGSAEVTVSPIRRGSTVRLVSSLAPRHPGLRALALVGRPFIRLGHDWVLDSGAKDFDRRAVRPGPEESEIPVQGRAPRRR